MRAALERQRKAVRKQMESLHGVREDAESGFFTTPWPVWPRPVEPLPVSRIDCDPVPAQVLAPLIARASTRHSLPPNLLERVIARESGRKPCAVSAKGALGLMQLMPATAAALGVNDPFDVTQNVEAGSRFLRELITRYAGDLSLALAAYNAGPGAVQKHGGIPPFRETRSYIRAVLPVEPLQLQPE
ncbi:MAG: lytic transglycosylase domain-containing protein [Acidobacteria bacterium]|nr:lytic transglycosylase domain-containing protein [Acidobacteriota bacterium]